MKLTNKQRDRITDIDKQLGIHEKTLKGKMFQLLKNKEAEMTKANKLLSDAVRPIREKRNKEMKSLLDCHRQERDKLAKNQEEELALFRESGKDEMDNLEEGYKMSIQSLEQKFSQETTAAQSLHDEKVAPLVKERTDICSEGIELAKKEAKEQEETKKKAEDARQTTKIAARLPINTQKAIEEFHKGDQAINLPIQVEIKKDKPQQEAKQRG